ncbi:MAG: hypothetical protein QXH30_02420, partial [Candidatus Bilamarchaeaceae archaeon]
LYNDGEATYLKFEVRNGLGYDIKITDLPSNILVKTQGTGTYDWVSPALEGAPGGVIKQGGKAVITLRYNGETPPLKGELMKMLVQLTYVSCAPEVNPGCSANAPAHTISGRIVARVEEKG